MQNPSGENLSNSKQPSRETGDFQGLTDLNFQFPRELNLPDGIREKVLEIVALDAGMGGPEAGPLSYYTPSVVERRPNGVERSYDIYSRLLEDRNIFLRTPINDQVAADVIAQLLFLDKEDKSRDVNLYIMSPGGSVTAGLAIKDAMDYIQADVSTYCIGQAASMGAVLLSAGEKGKRFALPNARIMIHQPHMQGVGGQASDIKIMSQEIERLKTVLNQELADATGKTYEEIEKATDRDTFLSAEEALAFGLIDEIVTNKQIP